MVSHGAGQPAPAQNSAPEPRAQASAPPRDEGADLPRVTPRRAAPRVLEAIVRPTHRFEPGRAERQGSGLAGTEGGGRGHRGARPQDLAEEVVELDGDAEPFLRRTTC